MLIYLIVEIILGDEPMAKYKRMFRKRPTMEELQQISFPDSVSQEDISKCIERVEQGMKCQCEVYCKCRSCGARTVICQDDVMEEGCMEACYKCPRCQPCWK